VKHLEHQEHPSPLRSLDPLDPAVDSACGLGFGLDPGSGLA
jgi:hypothetical protein